MKDYDDKEEGTWIESGPDDNFESIMNKILNQKDLNKKLGVYQLFTTTHFEMVKHIDFMIQVKDEELWELIRKIYYPTFWEKIKRKLGLGF